MRVLKPGGTIVVSSLKPYADLSQIYRNFVDQTENNEELEEARKLLTPGEHSLYDDEAPQRVLIIIQHENGRPIVIDII